MFGIRSLLIANRGEIAVRIIRACRELGVRAVAVYSEADTQAMHVRLADAAVAIGPAPASESYLRVDKIVAAALAAGVEAVHPGYGFLSENADFAEAVRAAGLIFVGPPAEAMRRMGSKTEARRLMRAAEVPVAPGYEGVQTTKDEGRRRDDRRPTTDDRGPEAGKRSESHWAEAAATIGYPVLVKAAGGGGGRGMRVVDGPAALARAMESARREAESAFGDERVFIEKYIASGRHIEIQVFGDAQGNVVHLFERECSVQRRHQKLIEEAPSPLLEAHPALREEMGAAAVRAARAVGYQNAGTVEFIVDPETLEYYFLEMNTRLQVEHPVTELVTGLDLVQLQLSVAAGERLPFGQAEVSRRGHALEARVYAEDPANEFYPSAGNLLRVVEPRAPGVRVDAGFETGDRVSEHYDALLAKVIAHGATRAECLARMRAALAQYHVLGVTTNIAFLRALVDHPEFAAGLAATRFVEEQFAGWRGAEAVAPMEALVAAALAETLGEARLGGEAATANHDPWSAADGFRIGGFGAGRGAS
jgi:acetyl/propionyl-CoA carboxylase alpha subunit